MTNEELTKKLKRQFRMTLILMLVSFMVLVGTTLAWFANNKQVDMTGMSTKIEVCPSLVISTDLSKLKTTDFLRNADSPFSVTTGSSVRSLEPASQTSASKADLYYVKNLEDIVYDTGLKKSGKTLITAAAVANTHYIDYTVYIASADKAMSCSSLTATFTSTSAVTPGCCLCAASVEIFVDSSSGTTYKTTLNLATTPGPIKIWDNDIPINTSSPLTVKIRFYMDGALTKSGGAQAYINSKAVDLSSFTSKITFKAN